MNHARIYLLNRHTFKSIALITLLTMVAGIGIYFYSAKRMIDDLEGNTSGRRAIVRDVEKNAYKLEGISSYRVRKNVHAVLPYLDVWLSDGGATGGTKYLDFGRVEDRIFENPTCLKVDQVGDFQIKCTRNGKNYLAACINTITQSHLGDNSPKSAQSLIEKYEYVYDVLFNIYTNNGNSFVVDGLLEAQSPIFFSNERKSKLAAQTVACEINKKTIPEDSCRYPFKECKTKNAQN